MNTVVLPGYNCQDTLEGVINEIPRDVVDEIIYVDDFSQDNSILPKIRNYHPIHD